MLAAVVCVTVRDLAAARDADVMAEWAGLGYYARARNLLKCARAVVADHGGEFPADHAELLKLPGIGPYTAAAVSSIAFDLPHTVLDGNVERVMARLYDIHTPLPAAKPELMERAKALTPALRHTQIPRLRDLSVARALCRARGRHYVGTTQKNPEEGKARAPWDCLSGPPRRWCMAA